MTEIIYQNVTQINDSELGEIDMADEKELDKRIAKATAYKEKPKKKDKKKKD